MICRYGLKCQNPNCAFGHPERKAIPTYDTSKIPCVHFKKGRCNKGSDCKFLHALSYAFVTPEQQRKSSSAGASASVSASVSPSQIVPEDPPKESEEELEEPELTESEFSVEEIGPIQEVGETVEPMEVEDQQVSGEHRSEEGSTLQGLEPVDIIEETVLTPPDTELNKPASLFVEESLPITEVNPVLAEPVTDTMQMAISELVPEHENPVPPLDFIGQSAEPEPVKTMSPNPLLESPPSFEQLSPIVSSPERVKSIPVTSPKVEGRGNNESPITAKIIRLPSSAKSVPTAKTTKMPRQQRQMNEVPIKTLEQIKREKEESRKSKERTSQSLVPSTPVVTQQISPKVTQMARVTLVRTNSKTQSSNIPSEPEPVKRQKLDETVEPSPVEILPEVSMVLAEELKEPVTLVMSDSSVDAAVSDEINALIAQESRPQEPVQQETVVELQPLNVEISPELDQPNPIVNDSPQVFEIQEKSPPEIELESGEIPQTYQEPIPSFPLLPQQSPVAEVLTEPLQVQFPVSIEVNSAPEVPSSPPQTAPSADVRVIQLQQKIEKGKQQMQTMVPSTAKKVIALPSNSSKTGPGHILTLEEIKERKRATQEALAKDPSKPEPKVAPGAGLKRPRDATLPKEQESVKRLKPTPAIRPVPSPSESLGDWEPLTVAIKDLDFSRLEEAQTPEDLQALKEIAQRLSTPEGFLELLDEMEEKVTELEVAKGLKPEPDPEFMVRCKSDVVTRGTN